MSAVLVRGAVLVAAVAIPTVLVNRWVSSAEARLAAPSGAPAEQAAVAAAADEGYCSPDLKKVLRRVLLSCGLLGEDDGGRGCQPVEARSVATMSGADFNALFRPMRERGGILEFEQGKAEL